MILRPLLSTIRETKGSLRRSLGWAGLALGVAVLPVVLAAALVSWPSLWAWRKVVRGRPYPRRRGLCLEGETVTLDWIGDSDGSRRALEDALRAVVDALPRLAGIEHVETLELRNPSTGFALDPEALEVISEDFVSRLTQSLWGAKLEYGELVVNGRTILGIDLEARSALVGHLSLDLAERRLRQSVVEQAETLGFELDRTAPPS
jgi:hypothetical protein